MNVFKEYAKYYDLLYRDKNYDVEVDYVDSLIKKYKDDANSILNLGCGTGRHDVLLTDKGYKITGIDISEQMISIAKKNIQNKKDLAEKLSFFQGDIRNLNLQQKFDVILSLFHVISYQVTNQDLLNSFLTVQKHLKDDGIFIFDCWYGPGVLHDLPTKRVKKISNVEMELERFAEPKIHVSKNIVDVNYQINLKDKINNEDYNFKEQHKMRYLFIPEVAKIIEDAGLEIVCYEEWLTGKEATFDSWNICFVCKKR